jgi:hypothetical protein
MDPDVASTGSIALVGARHVALALPPVNKQSDVIVTLFMNASCTLRRPPAVSEWCGSVRRTIRHPRV